MHELSVTQSILDIALRHAHQAEATRVTNIALVIGQLSSIVDDSVQFYWDMISAGTICEGATLHFTRVPAALLCLDCDQRYHPGSELSACPACGGVRIKVVAGDEFYVDSITIER